MNEPQRRRGTESFLIYFPLCLRASVAIVFMQVMKFRTLPDFIDSYTGYYNWIFRLFMLYKLFNFFFFWFFFNYFLWKFGLRLPVR